ncbi:hypothetical protein GRZ55_23125, partial [Chelativorans sp. ZYF759]|uniref:hypothetical protein n=1 Tax=Chelativorans sp. ZYF759 TaxID=2692213 RepID=UPI00145CB4D3
SHLSKAFGFEPAGARHTCSLQSDLRDLAHKCADATKLAGFALATSALVVAGANAEGVPKRLTYDEIQSKTYMEVKGRIDCLEKGREGGRSEEEEEKNGSVAPSRGYVDATD